MASNGKHVSSSAKNKSSNKSVKSAKHNRNVDQIILDKFWTVCNANTQTRNNSIQAILDILRKQKQTNGNSDLNYCVERLVRGLSSARQFARHGFSTLLTLVLTEFSEDISLEAISKQSITHLGKVEEVSNHDHAIGWSLIIAALMRSKRLDGVTDEHILNEIFNVLYTLGTKKPYIELVICELVRDFISIVNDNELLKSLVLTRLDSESKTDGEVKPFSLFLFLLLKQHIPEHCKDHKYNEIFIAKNMTVLSSIIKSTSGYLPSIHPLNHEIIKIMLNTPKFDFPHFWKEVVDSQLFIPNQIEKGFLGFELIKVALPLITTKQDIQVIFSPSFLRLFIQALSTSSASNHHLQNAAKQLCEFIINYSKACDKSLIQIAIVKCFIKEPASLMFDDISKTKFFSNLLSTMNIDSIKSWLKHLKLLFIKTDKLDGNDILRIRCVQQISFMAKLIANKDDIDVLWIIVKFLFYYSYFEETGDGNNVEFEKPIEPISEKLRLVFRDGFRSTLLYLSVLGSKTNKEKLFSEAEALVEMIKYANNLMKSNNIRCLCDSKINKPWTQIMSIVLKLSKRNKTDESKQIEIKIFLLLNSLFALLLFEEVDDIENILPDLNECMERAINYDESSQNDDSFEWADVLTDLIISMLAKCSKLTRNVLSSAFRHICAHITEIGLQQLINAITSSTEDVGDDLSSESDDDENDSEKESNEQSLSESDNEPLTENPNIELDEKFRNDVITALGPAAQNDDEESVYLSDSEMFQFDETLSAVFQSKFNSKKEAKEKEVSLITFRLRCFDLIKIFLSQKEPNYDHILSLVSPIVSAAKNSFTKNNQLTTGYIQALSQISHIKDFKDFKTEDNGLQSDDIKQLYGNLVNILTKTSHPELQKALIQLCGWIVSLSRMHYPNDKWYIPIIKDALEKYFEKKNSCQIPARFFSSLTYLYTDIAIELIELFEKYAFMKEMRTFKKSPAIEILTDLFKEHKMKNITNFDKTKHLIAIRENTANELITQLECDNAKMPFITELIKLFDVINGYFVRDKELQKQANVNAIDEQLLKSLRSLSPQNKKKLSNKANHVFNKIIKCLHH